MSIKKPKNRIVGQIDPAFEVIVPEHMKEGAKKPTTIYAITTYVLAHNETDAIIRLGQGDIYGDAIHVEQVSKEEYDSFIKQETLVAKEKHGPNNTNRGKAKAKEGKEAV